MFIPPSIQQLPFPEIISRERFFFELWKELEGIQKKDKKIYKKVRLIISRVGIRKIIEYLLKEGKRGMMVLLNGAKWMGNPNVDFKSEYELRRSFLKNQENLGRVWLRRPLSNEREYLKIIKAIITSPYSKKIMWSNPGIFGVKARLGYLFWKNRKDLPILVVIDEHGYIEYAELLRPPWQYLLLRNDLDAFFTIDVFPKEWLTGKG